MFTDGLAVRAYPGRPTSAIMVAGGECSKPFHVRRVGQDEVQIEPADACKGELWTAPIATVGQDGLAPAFVASGQEAITTSQFRPTPLSPVRGPLVLKPLDGGRYARQVAKSGSAEKAAADRSASLYASVPLFSPPLPDVTATSPTEPVYVFHQIPADDNGGSYPPIYPPSDWGESGSDQLDTVYVPPCDPTTPVGVGWGTGLAGPGPKPTRATAIRDLHGARWTYYADGDGRVLRTVNHDTGASWWMNYDPDGRVVGILAPDGARQCLTHDTRGNVTQVLTLPAFVAGIGYAPPIRQQFGWTGWPSRLGVALDPRDPSRALRRWEHDGAGNLRAIIEADGLRTEVTPVGGSGPDRFMPGRITGPDGSYTRISYDTETGTIRALAHDAGGPSPVVTEVVSDAAGRPTWATSPLGLVQTFTWDGPVLASREWDADGLTRTESYGYDEDVQLTAITSGRRQTTFAYDPTGALVRAADVALDGSVPEAVRCQRTAPGGRVREQVSAEGIRTRFTYDGEGRIRTVVAGDLGPSDEPWDDACPAHATGTSVAGTVAAYEYDTSGRVVAAIDGRGLRTTWQYDGFGRPIVEVRPDLGTVRTGYDALGNVVWQAMYSDAVVMPYGPPSWGDPALMAAVELRYDARGRLEEEARWHFAQGLPVGDGYARTRFKYDDVNRAVIVTDDLGRATRVHRDGVGRVAEVRLPDGSAITTAYLDGGRTVRTRRTTVGGPITELAYLTPAGAVTQTAVEVGGQIRTTGSTTWADPFLPATTTTATGATSTLTLDAFERIARAQTVLPDGTGEDVSVGYDREDRVVWRRSDPGLGGPIATWRFGFDALGRQERATDPTGAVTATTYLGPTELPAVVVDPRGIRTTYGWALGGWLETAQVDAPGTLEDVALRYTHDPAGQMRLAQRQDGGGITVATSFAWDSLGNLVVEADSTLGATAVRTHTFDGAGQRIRTGFAGGPTVTRGFDLLGRQTSLMVNGESPATATWTYDLPGGPRSRRLRNGVETTFTYDELAQLTRVLDRNVATGATLASLEWELPFDGVPRRLTEQLGPLAATSSVFAIDSAGRLAATETGVTSTFQLGAADTPAAGTAAAFAAMSPARTTYELDGRNNWQRRTVAGGTTSYARDPRDAVTAVGPLAVQQDASGALTHDGTASYTYDALGLLASVTPVDGGARAYQRDGLGRVVAETDLATGEVTRFGWDGNQRVLVKRPDGSVETTVAAEGLDQPVATIYPSGERRYYHQDRQGSVYMLSRETGAPAALLSYSPYGEVTLHDGAGRPMPATFLATPFGYHGLPHDFALGLVDMRARVYKASLGRFLSPDPIGLAGGPNLFAFVDSAPLAYRDPLGLEKERTFGVAKDVVFDLLGLRGSGAFTVNGTTFIRFGDMVNGSYAVYRPEYGRLVSVPRQSWDRMVQDAYDWEAHPEKGQKFDATVAGLQLIPNMGMGACRFHPMCRGVMTAVLLLNAPACANGDIGCFAAKVDNLRPGIRMSPSAAPGGGAPGPGGAGSGAQSGGRSSSSDERLGRLATDSTTGRIPPVGRAPAPTEPLNWSWKSKPTFGHTFLEHGQGSKNTRSLVDRARGENTPQGQWLNNEAAAAFLARIRNTVTGPAGVQIPPGLGQVILPDGTVLQARRAIVVPLPGAGYRTAYPTQ